MYWLNDTLFGNQLAQITFDNNKFINFSAEMDLAYHETYIYTPRTSKSDTINSI